MIAATGFNGQGINPNMSIALGGIIACGLVYTVIGLVVMKIGTRWIERLCHGGDGCGGDGDWPELAPIAVRKSYRLRPLIAGWR